MNSVNVMKATFEDGREAQYQEMMQELARMQAKYKGVRGELLEKVRAEFAALKPSRPAHRVPPAATVAAVPAEKMLPSCRLCGRGMKLDDASGNLVCDKGHTRAPS